MTPEELFQLEFVTNAPVPEVAAACDVPRPTYLLRPHRLDFYGHMLRDNFHHIATNLNTLGLDHVGYDLLLWRTQLNEDSSSLHVSRKYLKLIADDMLIWEDVVAKCSKALGGALCSCFVFHMVATCSKALASALALEAMSWSAVCERSAAHRAPSLAHNCCTSNLGARCRMCR